MRRYVISRVVHSIFTLLVISILVFSILHLIPGDPALIMVARSGGFIDVDEIRHQLGLDLPLPVQYWRFLRNAVHGDLGKAMFQDRAVTAIIMMELPYSIRLACLGMVVTMVLGLSFGILSALSANSWLDTASTAIAVLGVCIPDFWLSLLLIMLFSVKLGWLPMFGPESLKVLILPAFVIGFQGSAFISRLTRSGLLEVLGQDYIRTARAKGLLERVVIMRHALKNALIPVVTFTGLQFARLLGGVVIVEAVFGRHGIGQLVVNAILQRDFPLAQGTVLFTAAAYMVVNVAVDIMYAYIDPRIRYEQ